MVRGCWVGINDDAVPRHAQDKDYYGSDYDSGYYGEKDVMVRMSSDSFRGVKLIFLIIHAYMHRPPLI